MTTSVQGLTEKPGGPDPQGRQMYEAIIARVKGISQYRDDMFSFVGIDGYWQTRDNEKLDINQWYKIECATKLKGGNAKEGSLYMDISRCRLATGDEIPQAQPQEQQRAASGNQSGQPASQEPSAVALGMCQNNAVTLLTAGLVFMEEGDDLMDFLLRTRDALYYMVTSQPYQPPVRQAPPASEPESQEPVDSPGNQGPPAPEEPEDFVNDLPF